MRVFGHPLWATMLTLMTLLAPSGAHAYRTLADDPELVSSEPIVWENAAVSLEVSPTGLSSAQRPSGCARCAPLRSGRRASSTARA